MTGIRSEDYQKCTMTDRQADMTEIYRQLTEGVHGWMQGRGPEPDGSRKSVRKHPLNAYMASCVVYYTCLTDL